MSKIATPTAQPIADALGAALDNTEGVQRHALELAGAFVRDALVALKPFEIHGGRSLPGIEKAVADEVKRLTEAVANLAAIVSLHLGPKETPAPPPTIAESVNEKHLEVVRQAKDAEAA